MATEYRARRGGNLSAKDAAVLGPYLQAMAAKAGNLSVEAVIEDAREPSSPLHDHFDWNLATAAMERWKWQARSILNSILIVQKQNGDMVERRLFLSLTPAREGDEESEAGVCYIQVQTVLADSGLRGKLWDKALGELASWARRWGAYPELKPVANDVQAFIGEHATLAGETVSVV